LPYRSQIEDQQALVGTIGITRGSEYSAGSYPISDFNTPSGKVLPHPSDDPPNLHPTNCSPPSHWTRAIGGANFLCHSAQDIVTVVAHRLVALQHTDPSLVTYKFLVLLLRAGLILYKRQKLVIGSTVVICVIAAVFGFVLGPATNEANAVVAMLGMGNVFIILSNLQFVFWMFTNHRVSSHTNYRL
jgi:hypothetical protein